MPFSDSNSTHGNSLKDTCEKCVKSPATMQAIACRPISKTVK